MRLVRSSILALGLFGVAACGGSSKDESTTPAANPCGEAANPCGEAANPCGETAPVEGADGTPADGEMPADEANPCGGGQ